MNLRHLIDCLQGRERFTRKQVYWVFAIIALFAYALIILAVLLKRVVSYYILVAGVMVFIVGIAFQHKFARCPHCDRPFRISDRYCSGCGKKID